MNKTLRYYNDHGFTGYFTEDTVWSNEKNVALAESLARAGSSSHRLINVPHTYQYLPPMIPSSKSWPSEITTAYVRSAYAFIAEIWTQILSMQAPKDKSLHVLWNRDVPKPNKLTALFWLINCESWPMANNWSPSPSTMWPDKSFLIPQGQLYEAANVRPVSYAESPRAGASQQSLSALMSATLTRFDREQFATMNQYEHPLFEPLNGFRGHFDATLACGLAYESIQESIWHLEALQKLRLLVTDKVSITPGMPTHNKNLYGVVGGHIRAYSESHLLIMGCNVATVPWTLECEKLSLNEQSMGTHIPHIMPKVWMGFTTPTQGYSESEDANAWAKAYLAHRHYGLQQLFSPNSFDWEGTEREALIARTQRLKKAGRIDKSTGDKKTQLVHDAFAVFANQFKGMS